jgi:hypothetical protein
LRRIRARLPEGEQERVDVVLGRAVNVLSIIHAHVYFPAYSCGLKDIGRCLGCGWSEPDASGLQSVAWRAAWEGSRDESLKAKLVRYNLEDCLALRAVTESLAGGFSALLRKVVESIDRYGLKQTHLHKHRAEVEAFFDEARAGEARSEVARGYRRRFEKYRGKLFAFLDHDGVPWSNNNAEHAIKCVAKYRQFADGRFTEASLGDYLVLLSVYQSCEYQGVDFLDFLRGKVGDQAGGFGFGARPPGSAAATDATRPHGGPMPRRCA